MKNWVILFLLLPLAVFSQDVQLPINKDGVIEYTEVIPVDSAHGSTLYSRARLFIAHGFNSATDVTKLEDEKALTLVTKGYLPRNYTNPLSKDWGGRVAFTFTIQCKDGRYRYTITDLEHRDHIKPQGTGGRLEREKPACGGLNMPKKSWNKIKSETNNRLLAFVQDLKATMAGSTKVTQNNW